MKINIMCDWCETKIKTVSSFEKVRDAQQTGDTICQRCKTKVAKVENWFVTAKDRYNRQIDVILRKLREEFKSEIAKGKFDVGKDLQDVGAESKDS